ncbi:MAG: type II toxin-antitoxin system RelB/DinJ family antitoxin [Bacillota bacterium]|nr:type II toxin-antitoxin system RelB/DinJ family antitoxin [Bacillota bacterium]
MAKEATLQVRMDAELKKEVEELYRDLGTSFSEAVRIFARQSVIDQGMPFAIRAENRSAYSVLNHYANPALVAEEENAFVKAMMEKHGKID